VKEVKGKFNPAHIIACGYDSNSAGDEIRKLYDSLGALPAGLLVNSIGCFEGVLQFLSQLPEKEVDRCTIGCFDYDPFCVLLRFPVRMIRQRAEMLIVKAYECIGTDSIEPLLTLVKPELLIHDS